MAVYRGWLMVAAVTGLNVLAYPAFGWAVAQWVQLAFVLPPPAGFGWSQSFAGSVFGSATLCAGALTFAAGVFVDRLGSRLSLLLTGGSLSLACLLASVAESSPALWVAFFVFGLATSFLQLIPKKLFSYWFLRRRGRALSVLEMGMFCGFGLIPFANVYFIEALGWRGAWQLWAAVLAGFTPLAYAVVRNGPPGGLPAFERPTAHSRSNQGGTGGLYAPSAADGDDSEAEALIAPSSSNGEDDRKGEDSQRRRAGGSAADGGGEDEYERSVTLSEALHGKTLWAMFLLVFCRNVIMQGMEFQMIAICAQAGFGPIGAAGVLSSMTLFAAAVNLGSGLLAERRSTLVPLQLIGIVGTALFLCVAWLMIETRSYAVALAVGPVFGMAETQYMALTVGLPTYFGKAHLGKISGLYYSVRLVAGAVGPALFGVLSEKLDGFRGVLLTMLALPAVGLLTVAMLPRYRKDETGG
jgi:MFS family permease